MLAQHGCAPDLWSVWRARLAAGPRVALNARIEYPERPGVSFPAEPPADALAWFDAKGYQVGFDYRDVWQEEHAQVFTVAKVMQQDLLEDIRAAVRSALAQGDTFAEFSRKLTPILQAAGWWGEQEMVDPATGEVRTVQLGSPRRLRTIYEMNLRMARAAGQWARIQRAKVTHPYLLYQLGPSQVHRELHVGFNALCLPVADPWWDIYFPPNGWGCKCWVRQISRSEYRRLVRDGLAVESAAVIDPATGLPTGHIKTESIRVQTTAPKITYRRWTNRRTGEVLEVPVGCDPGFAYNAGRGRRWGLNAQG